MASVYPGGLDSFATDKTNATVAQDDHPEHHNDLADAVNKIEAELGVDPSGAADTVADRLAAIGQQSFYVFTPFSLASAAGSDLSWPAVDAGPEVLDLTDPLAPAFVDPDGVYQVELVVSITGYTADATKRFALSFWSNEGPNAEQDLAIPLVTGGLAELVATMTFSGASGHVTMAASAFQNSGGARTCSAWATITRLA